MTKITLFSWENLKTAIVALLAVSSGIAIRSNSKKIENAQGYCEGLAISLETTSKLARQITGDVLSYNIEKSKETKEMLYQLERDLKTRCRCYNFNHERSGDRTRYNQTAVNQRRQKL